MKLGRLKKDKKLNYGISFSLNPNHYEKSVKTFSFWFFILKELPEEGTAKEGTKYWGLWYIKDFLKDK